MFIVRNRVSITIPNIPNNADEIIACCDVVEELQRKAVRNWHWRYKFKYLVNGVSNRNEIKQRFRKVLRF